MRYVKIEPIVEDGRQKGYSLDADQYLDALPSLLSALPRGAAEFASDADHYFFFGRKCVKDLKLSQLSLHDANDQLSLALDFDPYQFKHDTGLAIRYLDVVELSINATAARHHGIAEPETRRLGYLQLDEILPHGRGFSHEIQMTGGRLWIVARDLSFMWTDV